MTECGNPTAGILQHRYAVGAEAVRRSRVYCGLHRRQHRDGRFGVSRHLDHRVGEGGVVTVVDDYGHHPVEMAATLAAARGAFPDRRLVLAFQPHRYTRTRDCFEDFVKVMGLADAVLLAEVYAAGESPIVAADGRALTRALRIADKVEAIFVDDIQTMAQAAVDFLQAGDVLLCMGAGSVSAVAGAVVEKLQERKAK